jgi:hypothetical protein
MVGRTVPSCPFFEFEIVGTFAVRIVHNAPSPPLDEERRE